jgi:uncharacterized protein (TIGR03067 family)
MKRRLNQEVPMRRSLPLLTLAALSLAFAPAPLPRPPKADLSKDDLKRLQGTWILLEETILGKTYPCRELRLMVISRERLAFFEGGEAGSRYAMRLDARRTPKAMDLTPVPRPSGGFLILRAAYALEGDTLRVSYSRDWVTRPASVAPFGVGCYCAKVYKRKKR